MKKYVYTVKGINTPENEEKIIGLINSILDVDNTTASALTSSVTLTVDEAIYSHKALEKLLSSPLLENGFELIAPPNVRDYVYAGQKKKKTVRVPLAVMLSVTAIVAVFCILFTFILASGLYSDPIYLPGINNGSNDPGKNEVINEDLATLDQIFKELYYGDVNDEEVGEYLLKAYVAATGDKYAEFYNAEEFAALMSEDAGELVGVGISIVNSTLEINGYAYKTLQVISVFEDSPALEHGVHAGDHVMIVGIGDEQETVDSLGHTMALEQLRGEEGTVAKFTVYRPDKNEESGFKVIPFEIERRKVVTQSVKPIVCDTNDKVGIVQINQFDLTTPTQFTSAVERLKEQGCEYFIFDVRNNPGGDLKSIEAVLSYFLDEGDLIISTEDKAGNTEQDLVKVVKYTDSYAGCSVTKDDIGKYKDLKFAVLTNENTASAAELFTATVRDYELGMIVGTKTYGKGCMQTIISLNRYGIDGALRVTTNMYFSKSHTVYHDIGITPDVEVELSEEAEEYNIYLLPHEKDDQLQTAIQELIK